MNTAISRSSESPKRTKFIRFVGRTMLSAIILMGLALILCWTIITPQSLIYTVENTTILRPYNLTDRQLNATFSFKISSFNGNTKYSIFTDSMNLTASYGDQKMTTEIPSFMQVPRNKTDLNVIVEGNFLFPFGNLGKVLRTEGVSLSIHLKGKVRYRVRKWTSMPRSIHIYCSPVDVQIGNSIFEKQTCDVDL